MVQIIEVLRGEKTVPQELLPFTGVPRNVRHKPGTADFRDIDLALIEPASAADLVFRGTVINRNHINARILAPIEKQSRDASKLCQKWLRIGLIGLKDDVRDEAGLQLLDYISGDSDEVELARAIIGETRVVKSDIASGFARMQDLLGCPLGAVIYIFRYMPDGRPISWPAGFREEVVAAAKQLDLPLFEPTQMVVDFGVEAALTQDYRHYSEQFLPVVGEALLQFAMSIREQSRRARNTAAEADNR
jgi:hypothetical protein